MSRVMLVALIAACLGGKRPNYHYYVLTPTAASQPTPSRATHERALSVDQVTIPGYLDREQIATRTVGHQLVYSTTDRWAEPLDQAIERTLREDLSARLAGTGIGVLSGGGAATYQLRVDVLRFERSGPDHVDVWARWSLRSEAEVLDSGDSHVQVATTGADSNAMASALSEAIARMATELASRVQKADVVASRP